jgi:hypothetical protein
MILLSSVIQTFEAEFMATYQNTLLPSQRKALDALKQCRTTQSLGVMVQCDGCEKQVFIAHSCGHRSCPHCQHHGSSRPSLVFTAFRHLSIKASNGWNGNSTDKCLPGIFC